MNHSNKKIIYRTAETGKIYACVVSTTIKYDKCGMAWFDSDENGVKWFTHSIKEVGKNQ